jgi:hypothetical protein
MPTYTMKLLTDRSARGILNFRNKNLADWWSSKQQVCVQTTIFGSEFVAARISVNQIDD